jgi:hypothetical protein
MSMMLFEHWTSGISDFERLTPDQGVEAKMQRDKTIDTRTWHCRHATPQDMRRDTKMEMLHQAWGIAIFKHQ